MNLSLCFRFFFSGEGNYCASFAATKTFLQRSGSSYGFGRSGLTFTQALSFTVLLRTLLAPEGPREASLRVDVIVCMPVHMSPAFVAIARLEVRSVKTYYILEWLRNDIG